MFSITGVRVGKGTTEWHEAGNQLRCRRRPGTPEDRVLREAAAEMNSRTPARELSDGDPPAPAAPGVEAPSSRDKPCPSGALREAAAGWAAELARGPELGVSRVATETDAARDFGQLPCNPCLPAGAPSLSPRLPEPWGQLGVRIPDGPAAALPVAPARRGGKRPEQSGFPGQQRFRAAGAEPRGGPRAGR